MSWVLLVLVGCTGDATESSPSIPPPSGTPTLGSALLVEPDFDLVGTALESPKSIVLISLDTVRADHLSTYGGVARVPAVDAMAAQGVVFEQAISHFPETCLSHWSMMSGVLPEVHGNVPAHGGSLYKGPSLAELASRQGLATGAFIGGVTLKDEACGIGRGFDVFDDEFSVDPDDMRRPARDVTQAAVEWIEAQSGPYFAFVHYFDAHFPYTPPAPWDTAYDPDYPGSLSGSDADLRPYRDGAQAPAARDLAHIRALYNGELSALDSDLKPLLDSLGPDVVVAITSDHGESFDHDYYFNHKGSLWDGVIHVPLIIRAPGILAGHRATEQVGLMDLSPTLLELAGLQWDRRMQGQSLATFGMGGDREHWRERVYSITDPWMPDPQFSVRTSTEKVIVQEKTTRVYNLVDDPEELNPLTGIPKYLANSRDQYAHQVASLEAHQVEPPAQREVDNAECLQLEALGYVEPGSCGPGGPPPNGTGGGPQGPAPGEPGGPQGQKMGPPGPPPQ